MPDQNQQQQQKSLGDDANRGPGRDDPSRSPEAGDPLESGRQHGRLIDEQGTPADENPTGKGGDTDLESGRHGTK